MSFQWLVRNYYGFEKILQKVSSEEMFRRKPSECFF